MNSAVLEFDSHFVIGGGTRHVSEIPPCFRTVRFIPRCLPTSFVQIIRPMSQSVSSSILPVSADRLRAFLGRTANLPQISDPALELEILSAPEIVTLGQRIEFRITAYGFKQRATHEYVTVEELQIIENQIDGPLRAWRHHQQIEVVGTDECRLTDRIEFEPPGGMLGFLLTEAKVKDSILDGMQIRYESLVDLISAGQLA